MAAQRKRYGRSYLDWLGPDIEHRVEQASIRAIDRTTLNAAEYARQNHPGWKNRTGQAEASIDYVPARLQKRRIRGNVTGGDERAYYFQIIEVKNGAALRNAGDVIFPELGQTLEDEYDRVGAR